MDDVASSALHAIEGIQEAFEESLELEPFAAAAAAALGEALGLEHVRVDFHRSGRLVTIGLAGAELDGSNAGPEWLSEFCDDARANVHTHQPYLSAVLTDPVAHAYACPMRYAARPIGLLIAVSRVALEETTLRALVTATQVVGKCCALTGLREQLELQTTEFSTLVEIGKAINARLDLGDLLMLVANTALQLTRGDNAIVSLAGAQGTPLEIAAACGSHERSLQDEGPGELGLLIEEVCETGQPLLIPSLADLKDPVAVLGTNERGVASLLAAPLRRREDVLGVISVYACDSEHGGRSFSQEDMDLLSVMADQAGVALENARLYGEMQDLYLATVRSLAFTIEAKDKYTRGHSDRVTEYAVAIADRMGFTGEEISALRFAGILHDIGKIAVSEEILNKPGKLTALEREVVQTHPAESARIIKPIGFLRDVVPIVEHHHERFDGRGYNHGLSGEGIPRGARILAVADAFEAMTSDRPYHAAMPWPNAIAELKRNAGTQFDPEVVEVFVGMILESLDMVEGA